MRFRISPHVSQNVLWQNGMMYKNILKKDHEHFSTPTLLLDSTTDTDKRRNFNLAKKLRFVSLGSQE